MTKLDQKSQEIIDTILAGVSGLFNDLRSETKEGFKALQAEMQAGFAQLKGGQQDLQPQINDLKADTPTQKEVDDLKARVDKYHPAT